MNKDISDLKFSLYIMQSEFDNIQKKVNEIKVKAYRQQDNRCAMTGHADGAEGQLEYLENQRQHSNIRMVGLQDKKYEKLWHDTEQKFKQLINDKLGLTEEFVITATELVEMDTDN